MRRALVVVGGVVALTLSACAGSNPNTACRGHDGVAKVNMTGNAINGIICRDGHYADGDAW